LNAVRTAERLDRSRFDLRLYAFRAGGPLRERFHRAGIPIVELPMRSLASITALRQARRLASELRRDDIDVLHCHDRYGNVLGAMAGRLAGAPRVITSRRWWSFDRRSHAVANGLAYRASHVVLANSPAVAELLRREGVAPNRIAVVPNFVEEDDFTPASSGERERFRRELGVAPDAFLAGIVANLRPVKDHATLLRAIARLVPRHPSLHLVCVGDGSLKTELQSLARSLGVEGHVQLLGHRADARRMHRLFDVSVLSSLHEGFPNSVVEAMAAGRPVVASRAGGIVDAVIDGETGLLVTPGDDAAFAVALERLLESPEQCAQLGAAGSARARRVYHVGAVLQQLSSLYVALVHDRSAAPGALPLQELSTDVDHSITRTPAR
jgi:glycosyltransferase involved in cell wall biosynthesis